MSAPFKHQRTAHLPAAAQLSDLATTSAVLPEEAHRLVATIAKELGQQNSCADFLTGFFSGSPSLDSIMWLIRHWAGIASARNSHSLLKCALSLASACQIAVASVLFQPDIAAGLAAPPSVVHCVETLPGFGFARAANPCIDGTIGLVCNRAFREHVCTMERLHATWRANEREMLSLFIHPEDLYAAAQLFPSCPTPLASTPWTFGPDLPPSSRRHHSRFLTSSSVVSTSPVSLSLISPRILCAGRRSILPHETGVFLSCVAGLLRALINSAPVTHSTQRVVRLLVDGEYVACHAMIKACSVDGSIYFGFFLTPVAAPPAIAAASLLELTHGFVVNGPPPPEARVEASHPAPSPIPPQPDHCTLNELPQPCLAGPLAAGVCPAVCPDAMFAPTPNLTPFTRSDSAAGSTTEGESLPDAVLPAAQPVAFEAKLQAASRPFASGPPGGGRKDDAALADLFVDSIMRVHAW